MRKFLDELLKRKDVNKGMLEGIASDVELIKEYCPDLYLDIDCKCDDSSDCKECWRKSLGIGDEE